MDLGNQLPYDPQVYGNISPTFTPVYYVPHSPLIPTISGVSQTIFNQHYTHNASNSPPLTPLRIRFPSSAIPSNSPIFATSFLTESPTPEYSQSLSGTPLSWTPIPNFSGTPRSLTPISDQKPFDAVQTIQEEIEKWLFRKDPFPTQNECEKYLTGMFTTFKKSREIFKFFNLFCQNNLIQSFLNDSEERAEIDINYKGMINPSAINRTNFKKINLIIFFLKQFELDGSQFFKSLADNHIACKQLLTLIWSSSLHKIGANFFIKSLKKIVNPSSTIWQECKKIYPPGIEINKTYLGKLTTTFFYIQKNQDSLLIPMDDKGLLYCIYPDPKPLSIQDVLHKFVDQDYGSFHQLSQKKDDLCPEIQGIDLTNVNLYNLLKTDSPLHLPPHFKFVQNYFVLMKDIFFTYLNNLSDQKLETEHTKYIMKFYLASCIFQWKLTENLKPEDLFTLNKEQFIAKTGFTNPSLQSKIWIYYSDNILVKAAIHDTSPVLPFKRKLSQIEHEETLESPLKKQK